MHSAVETRNSPNYINYILINNILFIIWFSSAKLNLILGMQILRDMAEILCVCVHIYKDIYIYAY